MFRGSRDSFCRLHLGWLGRAGRERSRERQEPQPFSRDQIDKYSWIDIGSTYLAWDVLATVLFAQFQVNEEIQNTRCLIGKRYDAGLNGRAKDHGVSLPDVLHGTAHAA